MNKNKKHHVLWQKKVRGMVDEFLPTIVFLLIVAVLILVFINFNIAVNKKDTINGIARKYLLLSETQGGLTTGDINDLEEELAALGFAGNKNQGPITLNNFKKTISGTENTTLKGTSGVGYGKEVVLSICVYTNDERLTGGNVFDLKKEDKWLPVKIVYHSTSKQ